MKTAVDYTKEIVSVAELYNAEVHAEGNQYVIKYQKLGEGSLISSLIEDRLGFAENLRIKMIPSDQILIVEV